MEQSDAEELFLWVLNKPDDEAKKEEFIRAFAKDPDTVLNGVKAVGQSQGLFPHEVHSIVREGAVPPWENCIDKQKCQPLEWRKPRALKDLVDIVTEASSKKLPVRAVGSGHSFSDITNTDGAILVDPHWTLNEPVPVDKTSLKPNADPANIFRVQCGITVSALNDALDNANLGLINMGAYDGQTVSGALSTGTHGSGIAFGPMASFLLSIVLVTETGVVYQIEPANGITDPSKFSGRLPEAGDVPVVLKQDDDWFHAAQVAMGCLGIIYSYSIRVCPAFSVSEVRAETTWEAVKSQLTPLLQNTDHFELLINPYAEDDGTHTCITVERKRLPKTPPSGSRLSAGGSIAEWAAVKGSPVLVLALNALPCVSFARCCINKALEFLPDYEPPYVDVSHKVFTLGIANTVKAWALELHCDAANTVDMVEKTLATFQQLGNDKNWIIAGPIGIRFVAASDAFLAPEAGRLTCTIECDMLYGIHHDRDLLGRVKAAICGGNGNNSGVRVHWGLDWDFTTAADVTQWYADLPRWQAVYRQLNSTGMFDNAFTKRLQLRG
ncbi:FAD-binding domain-containing protein [Echria macrotheca]|uniref:D-arabinono-1,4-lactone oxidase n=1 Tax=Echria macrotheca TaxID=438768 RepID=A0AAJ0BHW5_9PEZI|nr:FAD-binding domain-containing protein [Echria macrotheca]